MVASIGAGRAGAVTIKVSLGSSIANKRPQARERLMPSTRAVQKKLRAPEWQVSSFMMDRALEAFVGATAAAKRTLRERSGRANYS